VPLETVLRRSRYIAEQTMRDEITISRKTGETYDPNTLAYVPVMTTLYDGKADVSPLDVQNRQVQAGEREVALRTFDVRMPFGTMPSGGGDFVRGDVVTVTSTEDPALLGHALVVVGIGRGGRRTARHLDAEVQD
jgi:hypothetical protein